MIVAFVESEKLQIKIATAIGAAEMPSVDQPKTIVWSTFFRFTTGIFSCAAGGFSIATGIFSRARGGVSGSSHLDVIRKQ